MQIICRARTDDAISYFNTGNVYASCPQTIANMTNEELCCTHRWFNQAPLRCLCENPLPNGNYYANLHFAEIYFMEASKRIFDVYVEGSKVAEDFDIVDVAGDHGAVDLSKLTTVTNGTLKIELVDILKTQLSVQHQLTPVSTVTGRWLPHASTYTSIYHHWQMATACVYLIIGKPRTTTAHIYLILGVMRTATVYIYLILGVMPSRGRLYCIYSLDPRRDDKQK